ncbi:predicted protein [Histoplasma capsulatum var. duboisii H88]|uniref:Predicted protein n=1 Tax=Ajellomyces capsulatus (strain H88) TaxID=544711 RepID=F0URA6_AJEC8|nr:predicted protein [Histoplasma capsulatum var. duboisii H88]
MAWIVSSRYRQVVRANASTKHTTALPVSLCMPHSDVRACAIAERGLTCLASPHPQQLQAASQMGLRQAPPGSIRCILPVSAGYFAQVGELLGIKAWRWQPSSLAS